MITMRTYAEEKRSGTIELLLTSPITDLADHPRQVPRRDGPVRGDAARHRSSTSRSCSASATRSWKPILAGYLGLLLLGGCFISVGLFISSLTKNQIVAGVLTFAVFLLLWIISWFARFGRADGRGPIVSFLSITEHFDDFAKGVIDTKHVVYYLSFITFGLFLTAKSVDTERWRG